MNVLKGQTATAFNETVCNETVFDELQPGDRIEVECGEILDAENNGLETIGTVLRTEHHCPRLPGPRLPDEKTTRRIDNMILLETLNGELVVVTIGKATVVRRA